MNYRRREAIWALSAGGVLFLLSALVFFTRPSGAVAVPEPATPADAAASADPGYGKLACQIIPERSRINVSTPAAVTLDYGKDGCINGRTQYAENGKKWERILVPNDEPTVSVLTYDSAARTYTDSRYFLTATQMAEARKLRGAVEQKSCTPSEADRQALRSQQAAIRDALPPQPDEWLVYGCSKAP